MKKQKAELPAQQLELLDALYENHLAVTAEKLRERNVEFFPLKPDSKQESYFQDRATGPIHTIQVEQETIAEQLRQHWEAQGLSELTALIEPLLQLSQELREEEAEQEVSPFIYAMF